MLRNQPGGSHRKDLTIRQGHNNKCWKEQLKDGRKRHGQETKSVLSSNGELTKISQNNYKNINQT